MSPSGWVLGVIHRRMEDADRAPADAQRRLHRALSRALAGTEVAQLQSPRALETLEGYKRALRVTEHTDYASLISADMHGDRRPGRFERRRTQTFGHTSSGRYVPFTRGHIRGFRRFSARASAQAVAGLGLHALLDTRTLMIQGNLEVHHTETGARAGYSSAVMVDRTPWLIRRRMLPGAAALRAPTLEDRVERLTTCLLQHRPRVSRGFRSSWWVCSAPCSRGPRRDAVRDALHQVVAYAWSGTVLGPYRAFLSSVFSDRVRFLDAVSATEGPLGIAAGPAGLYRPALNDALLVFEDVQDPEDRRLAHELVVGRRYSVLLGSFAGLLGYRTHDVIEVHDARPLRFSLVPRRLDVERAWAALGSGVSDFSLYRPVSGPARLLVESSGALPEVALAEVAELAGASSVVPVFVPEGHLARSLLKASLTGLVKKPWMHASAQIHSALLDGAADAEPAEWGAAAWEM